MTDQVTSSTADATAVYDTVARRGAARQRDLASAESCLRDAMRVVRQALERGVTLNLTEVARRAGVSKQTVYNHLPPELVAARGLTPDPADPDTPEETTT